MWLMMYRWRKVFQLSKTISKINFSFLNFRYKLKERPDTYFIVLTCFVLSIAGVFYYYYFQMLGQLYDGLSEREVGLRLGITQSVVNKRKARILIKLRKIIES